MKNKKALLRLALMLLPLVLCACGQHKTNELPTKVGGPTTKRAGACLIVDSCTNSTQISSYECRRGQIDLSFNPELQTKYPGETCLVTFQDYQQNPNCETSNPTDTCRSGWTGASYPCCFVVQGPGPAAGS